MVGFWLVVTQSVYKKERKNERKIDRQIDRPTRDEGYSSTIRWLVVKSPIPKNMKVDWEHHLKLFLKLGHELGEKKTLALISLAN